MILPPEKTGPKNHILTYIAQRNYEKGLLQVDEAL